MNSEITGMKFRLTVMNFLQFGAWGAYLTSMGTYLWSIGLGTNIGIFYAMQGIVSLFMPALMGIIADRWIQADKVYGLSHCLCGIFFLAAGYYGMISGKDVNLHILFTLYSLSVAFYMPTLALANSVAYTCLDMVRLDPIRYFPSIRIFGTIGFICTMWITDVFGFQSNHNQFIFSGILELLLALYIFAFIPPCPNNKDNKITSLTDAFGLRAFTLFKEKKMALFFIFSMLLGVSLQITNGYANPFITGFKDIPEYTTTFGVNHANMLISLSQISETLCILLIPFVLKRFGIKRVMLIAMLAWVLRFGLFGLGNPGPKVWMFVLSMIVYGVAFDFFNISGSLFVNKETDLSIRSSAQGLFVLMTNGIGATIGTLSAQAVVNHFVHSNSMTPQVEGWSRTWFVFAAYALVVAILFAVVFRYKHEK